MTPVREGASQQAALRAVYKSYPAEEQPEILRDGPVEITTTRPSFWNDDHDELTWGDQLNALIIRIGAEAEQIRAERRIVEERVREAEDAADRATESLRQAKEAWDASKSPEAAVALAEAQDRQVQLVEERDKARYQSRRSLDKRVSERRELISFLEDVAWAAADVDLDEEYHCVGCDC